MWSSASATAANQGVSTPTPPPAKPKRYRCKLSNVADVNREIQRVYREARSNILDTGDASKLAHILSMIARIHEATDLEARLAALEARS
ncbi:MAG: hypothetical protein A3E77_17445 [Sphingopyxis sp. RIFCSPHIGHO2_12_FULL_65_19]|nr:MAG: hypothetical protein A3E77_17445 [Sphingopyxis sp. RIFCSPHIGHO2_12_FULL_65_19]